jgi:hypothetical protein
MGRSDCARQIIPIILPVGKFAQSFLLMHEVTNIHPLSALHAQTVAMQDLQR